MFDWQRVLSDSKRIQLEASLHLISQNYSSFDSLERRNELNKLKASLASPQNILHRDKNNAENATYASYEVAHLTAKHGKPFSYGEFV